MSDTREQLIRSAFQYERDFFYREFRKHHWHTPELVKACPDPGVRDEMLRGFWNQDAETRYPEYRASVAGLSTAEVANLREEWIERLNGIGLLEFRQMLDAAADREPANDKARGPER